MWLESFHGEIFSVLLMTRRFHAVPFLWRVSLSGRFLTTNRDETPLERRSFTKHRTWIVPKDENSKTKSSALQLRLRLRNDDVFSVSSDGAHCTQRNEPFGQYWVSSFVWHVRVLTLWSNNISRRPVIAFQPLAAFLADWGLGGSKWGTSTR